jgi:fumarate hydratase class II
MERKERTMVQIVDTEIKDGLDAPGTLLDGGTYRVETDSLGEVLVPADRLWGAQTQRSLIHFSIGDDHMPKAVYHAYGYVKKAAPSGWRPTWRDRGV